MFAALFWVVVIIGVAVFLAQRKRSGISSFGLGKPDYEIWSHGGYVGLHLATSQIAILGRVGDSSRKEKRVFPLAMVRGARWQANFLYVEISDMDTPEFRIMMNNPSVWAGRITQAETAARKAGSE